LTGAFLTFLSHVWLKNACFILLLCSWKQALTWPAQSRSLPGREMALPEIGPEASKSHESREGLQGLQGSRASKKSSHLKADNLRTSVASVAAGATQDAEGQRSTSLKIPVQPSLSKRSVSTLGTSRSVWSSNRWLAECTAGLKATESKCWSQLLQNLTGEQVKWGPAKSPKAPTAPNKRRLAKKALHGILLRKPNQRVLSHEDRRMVRKELSRESVAFSDDALEHERSLDTRSRKNPSSSAQRTSSDIQGMQMMQLLDACMGFYSETQ